MNSNLITFTDEYIQSKALGMLDELKEKGCINISQFDNMNANIFDLIYSKFINALIFAMFNLNLSSKSFNNIKTWLTEPGPLAFITQKEGGVELINEVLCIRESKQKEEEEKEHLLNKLNEIDEWSETLEERLKEPGPKALKAKDTKEGLNKCHEVLTFLNDVISHKRYGRSVATNAKFNIEEYLYRTE